MSDMTAGAVEEKEKKAMKACIPDDIVDTDARQRKRRLISSSAAVLTKSYCRTAPSLWTPYDVSEWIVNELHMAQDIGNLFVKHLIDGAALHGIQDFELTQLGIEPFANRWKLLVGFEALRVVSGLDLGESVPLGRIGAKVCMAAVKALPPSAMQQAKEDRAADTVHVPLLFEACPRLSEACQSAAAQAPTEPAGAKADLAKTKAGFAKALYVIDVIDAIQRAKAGPAQGDAKVGLATAKARRLASAKASVGKQSIFKKPYEWKKSRSDQVKDGPTQREAKAGFAATKAGPSAKENAAKAKARPTQRKAKAIPAKAKAGPFSSAKDLTPLVPNLLASCEEDQWKRKGITWVECEKRWQVSACGGRKKIAVGPFVDKVDGDLEAAFRLSFKKAQQWRRKLSSGKQSLYKKSHKWVKKGTHEHEALPKKTL